MSEHGDVRYPVLRNEVLDAMKNLSDPEYQQRVWIDRKFPSANYYDDFDMVIHILYDDTIIAEDACSTIGDILKNKTEAQVVEVVIQALEEVFDEGSRHADFEVLRARPSWPKVIEAAAVAWKAMIADPEQGTDE
ncbi:MAG: SCO4402 family protein [Pseudonocardiaceae bacterium]